MSSYGDGDYGAGGYGGYTTSLDPGDYGYGAYGDGPYGTAPTVVLFSPPTGGVGLRPKRKRPKKIREFYDDRADIALQDEDDAAIALVLTLT